MHATIGLICFLAMCSDVCANVAESFLPIWNNRFHAYLAGQYEYTPLVDSTPHLPSPVRHPPDSQDSLDGIDICL